MMVGSTSAFIFAQIVAGLPSIANCISRSISPTSLSRRPSGAMASFSSARPARVPGHEIEHLAASRHSAGSDVKNERSV